MQWVKDLMLSRQWLESLLWHRFDPWPGNFYMPWVWQRKGAWRRGGGGGGGRGGGGGGAGGGAAGAEGRRGRGGEVHFSQRGLWTLSDSQRGP